MPRSGARGSSREAREARSDASRFRFAASRAVGSARVARFYVCKLLYFSRIIDETRWSPSCLFTQSHLQHGFGREVRLFPVLHVSAPVRRQLGAQHGPDEIVVVASFFFRRVFPSHSRHDLRRLRRGDRGGLAVDVLRANRRGVGGQTRDADAHPGKGEVWSVGWWSQRRASRRGRKWKRTPPNDERLERHALPLVRHGLLELRELARCRGHVARHGGRRDP